MVYHSDNAQKAIRFLKRTKMKTYFIYMLDDDGGKRSMIEAGHTEMPLLTLETEDRLALGREYIGSIAALSAQCASVSWWANELSEKNEHLSYLYSDLCMYWALLKTIDNGCYSGVLVVACSQGVRELIDGFGGHSLKSRPVEGRLFYKGKRFLSIFSQVLKAVCVSCGMLLRSLLLPHSFKKRIKHELSAKKPTYIIRTWLDRRFLKNNEPAGNDAYFGCLPQEAMDRGEAVVMIAGVLSDYKKIVRKAAKYHSILIVPEEYFLSVRDLLKAAHLLVFERVKQVTDVYIKGADVTSLYKKVLRESAFSGGAVRNILRYFIAQRLSREIADASYIHTYENYAWEKMWVLGIKKVNPESFVMGFQHAFVSRSSFKYFPGPGEGKLTPLPDRIITLGEVTKRILENYGDYTPGTLVVGCALRQAQVLVSPVSERSRFKRVLVPLTMSLKESERIINFLSSSGLPASGLEVAIRSHPASDLAAIKNRFNGNMPENFRIDEHASARESMDKSDMVLYTWSTLAIEGLRSGLPAIHLDILGPMLCDPLFECAGLKRTVNRPEDLTEAVDYFYSMTDAEYNLEAAAAREYCAEYFKPVNKRSYGMFFMPDTCISGEGRNNKCAGY